MLAGVKAVLRRLRAEGQDEIETPDSEEAIFVLHYGDLEVGSLHLRDGLWTFIYCDDFKRQSVVQPLVDFPDPTKTYSSDALWPFFMARIPSIAQPQVQETIATEGLDQHNSAEMLRRFGRTAISNPFVLEPV